jgi:hypothetical protein
MGRFIKLLIWVICTILIIEIGFALLSMADTLANISGIIVIALYAFVSIKTEAFTNIKIVKK